METKKKPTDSAYEQSDMETSKDDELIKNIWKVLRNLGDLAHGDAWPFLNIH